MILRQSRPSFRVLILLFCLLALSAGVLMHSRALGQNQPPRSQASVRADTVLVQVPVIVTDQQGHPLEGLNKEEFSVKEDGKPQTIAVFEHLKHAVAPSVGLQVPAGIYTNRVQQAQSARLTIIAIDAVSTAMTERQEARNQLLDFISRNVSVDQPVALIMLGQNKIKVLHDFTTDPRVLVEALRNVVSGHSIAASITSDDANVQLAPSPLMRGTQNTFNQMAAAETETIQTAFQTFIVGQRRTMVQNSLDLFNGIARAFAGVPGRKSLIWLTNGESIATGDVDIAASMDRGQTVLGSTGLPNTARGGGVPRTHESPVTMADAGPRIDEYFERTWHLLNSANIAVYPLDISNASNPGLTNPALRVRSALQSPASNLGKLEQFADSTGGSLCVHSSNLDDCFKKAAEDSQSYYMLGYYADSSNKKTDWRRIQVSVARKDVRVRARTGYYPHPYKPDDKGTALNQLLGSVGSPLQETSLPLEVKLDGVTPIQGEARKKRVAFTFFVPPTADFIAGPDNHMNLAFAAVAKLPDATPVAQFVREAAGALKPQAAADLSIHGFVLPASIDLAPGQYELKCVVRDNQSGHIGSISIDLKVGDDAGPHARN